MVYNEYAQLRDELMQAAKETKTPIMGHFELTARCNLNCKMCYVHNQDNAKCLQKELTTEQWKRIFDEAYDCEMLYATLSGGECLLRKDFKELYLHLWNKRVFLTIYTNGTLINDDYVEFFKNYPPALIQISLYGSSEEGYLNVTEHKGFEKTVYAIRALMAAGITVRVAVTPSKYMKDDYINILRFCNENKFNLQNNELYLTSNRDDASKDDYYLTEDEILSLSIQRAELRKTLVPVENPPKVCGPMCDAPEKGMPCKAGNVFSAVTWEGRMYPCYVLMTGEGPSLLEMSYAEAWEKTVKTANEFSRGAECVGCAYDHVCPKCLAVRLQDLHSGKCDPTICEMTRKLVAAGVKKL